MKVQHFWVGFRSVGWWDGMNKQYNVWGRSIEAGQRVHRSMSWRLKALDAFDTEIHFHTGNFFTCSLNVSPVHTIFLDCLTMAVSARGGPEGGACAVAPCEASER